MFSVIITIIIISIILISIFAWYFSNILGKKLIDYYLKNYEQVEKRIIDYQNASISVIKKNK